VDLEPVKIPAAVAAPEFISGVSKGQIIVAQEKAPGALNGG
jgi:hypothetical protein